MTRTGFTLPELLLVLGIMAILFTLSVVSLLTLQHRASLNSLATQFLSDYKSSQLQAMAGDSLSSGSALTFGIHIDPHSYVLFHGSTYSPSNPTNFSVAVDDTVTLSATPVPDVTFAPGTGEISGATTITFTSESGSPAVLEFNKYGALISSL